MRIDNRRVSKLNPDVNIHNVTILDGSGSMGGSKYSNACTGIMMDFETCQQQGFKSFTFVEFNGNITTHYFMEQFSNVNLKFNDARDGTPLYQTIGETLDRLLKGVPKNDKVLVKIFTDGEENESNGKYANPSALKALIATCEARGFTITFIGTENDTKYIVRHLNIDISNTLVHDNTGEGVKRSFETQVSATIQYRKSLDEGEDVSGGFYTKVVNN